MNSRWKMYLLYASLIIIGGGLLFILIETIKAKNTGFGTKTLWDWMELLIIPLVLASGAFYLNRSERAVERQLAEDRTKIEREIATDRQQEATLQSYLDRMADLLLKDKLLTTKNKAVRDLARLRTLAVLEGLDSRRKGTVIIFLYEANLISAMKPIIKLGGANLKTTNLVNVNLKQADLSGTKLQSADLRGAILEGTLLIEAVLEDTKFNNANLRDARILGAFFGSEKTVKHFMKNFKGAIMPDGTKHE